jgi:DUF2892 family protein
MPADDLPPRLRHRKETVTMDRNIGIWERVLRVTVGVLLLAIAIGGPRSIWGLAGIIPLVTGALGFSLVYRALGIFGSPSAPRQLHAP